MPKLKVLFITSKLQHYRIPILNIIGKSENIDLTVAYSTKSFEFENISFKEKINKEKKVGPFTFHQKGFINYCKSFDVVVSMFYLQKISLMQLLFHRKYFKLIYWGIGVKASQNSKFDEPTFLNKFRYRIAKKSDAMIFYTDYAVEKYFKNGVKREKLFTMHNTVYVIDNRERRIISTNKNKILFIGAFNKSKKIFELLNAYKDAFAIDNAIYNLELVGKGVDYEDVEKWIKTNELSSKIKLLGPVFDENEKEVIFSNAIACISPGQAGLSVLSSFGYGVPFITQKNANTGGERLNIIDSQNGVLYDTEEDLKNVILDLKNNKDLYLEMGEKAQQHYYKNRTPEIMANGFIEAVNYVKTK